MNLPRYTFSKESEPELLKFLKVAKDQKLSNKNCDLASYEVWNKLLPLDSSLKKKLVDLKGENVIPIINLDSDEEIEAPIVLLNENVETEDKSTDYSSISDMVCTTKEDLVAGNDLSDLVKQRLPELINSELKKLFEMLGETLNGNEIYHLGTGLQDIMSNDLLLVFCHYLLIPEIKKEYNKKINSLVDEFSTKYSTTIKEEYLSVLPELTKQETIFFLNHLKKLNLNFRSMLLRDFILTVDTLNENYLMILDDLLNGQVEYEALNKLVELMSNMAEDYTNNTTFGHLLMQTIDALGPNLIHLEQPLKHIIAGHKSAWKFKLEKKFNTCYEDSLLFSQSFCD